MLNECSSFWDVPDGSLGTDWCCSSSWIGELAAVFAREREEGLPRAVVWAVFAFCIAEDVIREGDVPRAGITAEWVPDGGVVARVEVIAEDAHLFCC